MSKSLLKPGTMVSCHKDINELVIWKSYRSDMEDNIDSVKSGDIMVILESRKTSNFEVEDQVNMLMDEWKIGAYLLLTPNGKKGWVGAGWIIPVTT